MSITAKIVSTCRRMAGTCSKCGTQNAPGVIRCARCDQCISPLVLSILTLLGMILLLVAVLSSFVAVIAGGGTIWLVRLVQSAIGLALIVGLRDGRYWAWFSIQVFWIICITLSVIVIMWRVVSESPQQHLILQFLSWAVMASVWWYIRTERVKTFCSATGSDGSLSWREERERRMSTPAKTVSSSRRITVTCPKCGTQNPPGVSRCAKCHQCIRPFVLSVWTLLCMILAPAALIWTCFVALGVMLGEWTVWSLDVPVRATIALVLIIGLRYGRYWAWFSIQIFWMICFTLNAIVFVWRVVSETPQQYHILGFLNWAVIVSIWWYIRTERVKTFCSAGRARAARRDLLMGGEA